MKEKIVLTVLLCLCFVPSVLALSTAEKDAVQDLIDDVNEQDVIIVTERDNLSSIIRINSDIDNDTSANSAIAGAELRMKNAAQAIVDLLTD